MVVGESSELAASEPWGGSLCCLRSREGLGMARAEPHNGKDRLQGHRLGAAGSEAWAAWPPCSPLLLSSNLRAQAFLLLEASLPSTFSVAPPQAHPGSPFPTLTVMP